MNKFLIVISYFLALMVGASGGYYFKGKLLETENMFDHMVLFSRYRSFAEVQCHNAGDQECRDALLDFAAMLEKLKQLNSPLFSENAYFVD